MAKGDARSGNGTTAIAEDAEITLGLLSAIEADSGVSQRTLSNELGVALGLANAYLKRCVKKGYVKITAVPRRRYTYYLTPQGFAEKARLTGEYLTSSLQFFRRARQQIGAEMATCAGNGWRRVALAGASELAEIATITAHDHAIEIAGIVDGRVAHAQYCGLTVVRRLGDLGRVDAVIVTGTENAAAIAEALAAELGEERVLVPELIQVSRSRRSRRRAARAEAGTGHAAEPGE
jgi:DNA-binding MarR family transcriptional regulator